jgi:hypothetical protein
LGLLKYPSLSAAHGRAAICFEKMSSEQPVDPEAKDKFLKGTSIIAADIQTYFENFRLAALRQRLACWELNYHKS